MDMHLVSKNRGFSEELGIDLIDALKRKQFFLEYQPIVSNQTGNVKGLEALIRMASSNGPVSPATFIPFAESSGLIDDIGLWVLEEVSYQAKKLFDRFSDDAPYISLNVSMVQLERPDFAERVLKIVKDSGAPAGSICIEVTESVFSTHRIAVRANLEELRRNGFKIFIDDFGTGYSTLVNLIHFPFDKLKIDKVFVDAIHKDRKSREVVAGIIKIAEALEKRIVVEGVEDEKQFWELMKLGATATQGYLFSKPVNMERAYKLISEGLASNINPHSRSYYTLYMSKAKIDEVDVRALVEKARINNISYNLTGFLLYSNGHFMQYLEGSEEKVTHLIDKITNDNRHFDMRIITNGWVTARLFPEWSMGFWSLDSNNKLWSVVEKNEVLDFSQWKARTLDLLQVSLEPALCKALFLSIANQDDCNTCVNKTMSCFQMH